MGYLVVGHGTREIAGQLQLLDLAEKLASLLAPAPVQPAFLELASPSIHDGVKQLANLGVEQFVTIPVLLFTAGHALEDIPLAVNDAAQRNGITSIGQSASLELHPAIVQLSAARFQESLGCFEPGHSNSLGLAMIGRGSGSTSATQAMHKFTELRLQQIPVSYCLTGFFAVQKPTVPETLDQLERCGCDILVVQPHLLFEGILMNQLREEVRQRQVNSPHRWVITRTLGGDSALALALAEVARQMDSGGRTGFSICNNYA